MKGHWIVAGVVLAAGAAWAQAGNWHVIENPERHICYRVAALPAGGDWRDHGPFNTFREAGAWEWRNRSICRTLGS